MNPVSANWDSCDAYSCSSRIASFATPRSTSQIPRIRASVMSTINDSNHSDLPFVQTPLTPCAIDTPHLDGYNSSRSILLEGLGDVPSGLAGLILPSPPNMFSKASMFSLGAPPRPPPVASMFLHNGATQGYNCRNSFLTIHNQHKVSQSNEVNTSNARVQTNPTVINT